MGGAAADESIMISLVYLEETIGNPCINGKTVVHSEETLILMEKLWEIMGKIIFEDSFQVKLGNIRIDGKLWDMFFFAIG